VHAAFGERATVVRPGLIVGPGDQTDRFTYWPVRIARGGEVLAPGNPADPVQIIDARDLAEWVIRLAEQGATGDFNAVGPERRLGVGGMLEAIRDALDADARFTWVEHEFLAELGVQPWSDMPVWVPPVGTFAGLGQVSNAKALAHGLRYRPLADTARATLEWHRSRPPERQAELRAGLAAEREAEVLAAWANRDGGR
jgi:2'-hydroxyisoflavone reductase